MDKARFEVEMPELGSGCFLYLKTSEIVDLLKELGHAWPDGTWNDLLIRLASHDSGAIQTVVAKALKYRNGTEPLELDTLPIPIAELGLRCADALSLRLIGKRLTDSDAPAVAADG